jgi:hypothetical protein
MDKNPLRAIHRYGTNVQEGTFHQVRSVNLGELMNRTAVCPVDRYGPTGGREYVRFISMDRSSVKEGERACSLDRREHNLRRKYVRSIGMDKGLQDPIGRCFGRKYVRSIGTVGRLEW